MMERYALLDTDFLIKAYRAQDGNNRPLLDIMIQFDDYEFFCHEKVLEKLQAHTEIKTNPLSRVRQWIEQGKIHSYSDADILCELGELYAGAAGNTYIRLLEKSCSVFDADFFPRHYAPLQNLPHDAEHDALLSVLQACDAVIPPGNSMGEKKTYVLLQMLQRLHGEEKVYVFCSDDRRARGRIAGLGAVRCLNILSLFLKLRADGYGEAQIRPFFDSFHNACSQAKQTQVRVYESGDVPRMTKISFEQAFEDIINERFMTLGNGDLKYKQPPAVKEGGE